MTEISDKVATVHRSIQKLADQKAQSHGDRLKCGRGCSGCCLDGLTVFEVEAERILVEFRGRVEGPASKVGCAFLGEEGECRIYDARPYVCRTQGLPLRWFDEGPDEGLVEYRDICELNIDGPPLERLPSESCWTIGHVESILQRLQLDESGDLRRIGLREVFQRLGSR